MILELNFYSFGQSPNQIQMPNLCSQLCYWYKLCCHRCAIILQNESTHIVLWIYRYFIKLGKNCNGCQFRRQALTKLSAMSLKIFLVTASPKEGFNFWPTLFFYCKFCKMYENKIYFIQYMIDMSKWKQKIFTYFGIVKLRMPSLKNCKLPHIERRKWNHRSKRIRIFFYNWDNFE